MSQVLQSESFSSGQLSDNIKRNLTSRNEILVHRETVWSETNKSKNMTYCLAILNSHTYQMWQNV